MHVMHSLDRRARHLVGYVRLTQIPPATDGKSTA
jgi:hypothetical protein